MPWACDRRVPRRGGGYQSDKAANVAQEINAEFGEGTAYGFGADATREQSVLALSRGVDEIFGRVDLLVYSAGIAKAAFISDFQLGDFDRSLQVNLVGYFLCAREFSRLMIRDGVQDALSRSTPNQGKWAVNTTQAIARQNLAA